jgi:hypothetical protein
MHRFFLLVIFCFVTLNLGACALNDVVDGVVQAAETPEKRSARLKRERQARAEQAEYRRQQEERKKEREKEMIAAILKVFRNTCSNYGYVAGTPDFNQCVGNEYKASMHEFKQEQKLLEMERAASRLAADQEALRRRQNYAEEEQQRRDLQDEMIRGIQLPSDIYKSY